MHWNNNLNFRVLKSAIILIFIFCAKLPEPNVRKEHHTKSGFKNIDLSYKDKKLYDVLVWQIGKLFKNLPSLKPEDYSIETNSGGEASILENKDRLSFTWIGHATVLIQLDGKNILTDPIWSDRCSPVSFAGPKRFTKPGIDIEKLPKIDIIVISHNHYDHMDLPTLKILHKKFNPKIFVGLKNKKFLEDQGLSNVYDLDWWDSEKVDSLEVHFMPTQHFSGRGLFDKYDTLWGSFILKGKKDTIYFAGDTAYFSGFKEIAKKFPNISVAILPVGAYEPRDFMKAVHMNPEESFQAFQDLKANLFLPMHYLTFVLADEALDEPLRKTKNLFQISKTNSGRLLDLKIGTVKFFP